MTPVHDLNWWGPRMRIQIQKISFCCCLPKLHTGNQQNKFLKLCPRLCCGTYETQNLKIAIKANSKQQSLSYSILYLTVLMSPIPIDGPTCDPYIVTTARCWGCTTDNVSQQSHTVSTQSTPLKPRAIDNPSEFHGVQQLVLETSEQTQTQSLTKDRDVTLLVLSKSSHFPFGFIMTHTMN